MTLIDKTIKAFADARGSVADAIESLYEVYKTEAWEGRYSSWSEFCEDGLQISKSLGSQYVAVYGYYIEESSLAVKLLREVDISKAYTALALPGTAIEKLDKARFLNRQELRAEASIKADGTEHECVRVCYCSICHRKMD